MNILTKSHKLLAEVKHMEDLPKYYDIPYFNDRLCTVLNCLLANRVPQNTHKTKDIMLCRLLYDYNIPLVREQCTWLAQSSMYMEDHKYKFNDFYHVTHRSQMANYIVDHIVSKCKIKHYICLYNDMKRDLHNDDIYDAIMRNIFAIYQNS